MKYHYVFAFTKRKVTFYINNKTQCFPEAAYPSIILPSRAYYFLIVQPGAITLPTWWNTLALWSTVFKKRMTTFHWYKIQFWLLNGLWSHYWRCILLSINTMTDFQLCNCNKDRCAVCCNAFFSSSWLKLPSFCAIVFLWPLLSGKPPFTFRINKSWSLIALLTLWWFFLLGSLPIGTQ